MGPVIQFVDSWRDLIIKIFGEHPLAGSLVTIIAIGAFFLLQSQNPTPNLKRTSTNLFFVFVGWAILVPILGFVTDIVKKVWELVEGTVKILVKVIGSLYQIYAKHPLLMLAIIILALISYFAWERWRPYAIRSRTLKVLCITICVVIVAHIAAPIADVLAPITPSERARSGESPTKTLPPPPKEASQHEPVIAKAPTTAISPAKSLSDAAAQSTPVQSDKPKSTPSASK